MATESGTFAPQPPDCLSSGPDGVLRPGCHLLRLSGDGQSSLADRCDGTLRVEVADDGATKASGDLYLHAAEPDPRAGVPVFPRAAYRYYVRVTEIRDEAEGLYLGFELYRFDHASATWSSEGGLGARLRRATPGGYPGAFLAGEVLLPGGGRIGELTIGWVSPSLRRAVIEIDRAPGCDAPLMSEAGVDWRAVFDAIGWDLRVDESDIDLVEPSGESWSAAELHAAMLERRDAADLDTEWRFWLACVRRLDDDSRGIMFDSTGADSNNVPREAVGIASDWTIPDEDPWGLAKGLRFGSARDPYFRTALHEIGHAMGLQHNPRGTAIMCPTEEIARSAVAPQQFPQNISWSYSDKDEQRLRHMPDHWIRPGGVPFGSAFSAAPALPEAAVDRGLELRVVPLLAQVPPGAPVRVTLTVRNVGPQPVPAPVDLSLQAGHVSGCVTDPSGAARSFRSIVHSPEPRRLEPLASGAERTGSITLLRGADGALFPGTGRHPIDVVMEWEVEGEPVRVAGAADVEISSPTDEDHARAARRVIDAPDALLTIALGGDHLVDGVAAIGTALANEQLKPHFAYLEAKRLASRFQERPADVESAVALVDDSTVMSGVERQKAQRMREDVARQRAEPRQIRH
jgi:Matrixin